LFLGLDLGEGRLAAEAHAPLLVDADALDDHLVAELANVLRAAHAEVGELGNVHQAFLAGEHLDEAAEFLDAAYHAPVNRASLDPGADGGDLGYLALHRSPVVGVDVRLAGVVFVDVDLRAGGLGAAADVLSARADQGADLFRIDLHGLDARRIPAELL